MDRKIKLDDDIRNKLLNERNITKRTAEEVSSSVGMTKSWLAQIENGRLQTIKKSKFIELLTELKQISNEEAESIIDILTANNDDIENKQIDYKKLYFDLRQKYETLLIRNNELLEENNKLLKEKLLFLNNK